MDRRSFLKGLLAAPIVVALAPLLPKSKLPVVPEVIAEAAAVADYGRLYYLTSVSFTSSGTSELDLRMNERSLMTFNGQSGYQTWKWQVYPPMLMRKSDQLSLVASGSNVEQFFHATMVEA